MKPNIRVTLSELATVELLELMKSMNIQNPTNAANTIITEFYKQNRLSPSEETTNDRSTSSQH